MEPGGVEQDTRTRSRCRCRLPVYRGPVKKDPSWREPRAPAIAIWTVTGLLAGLAAAIVLSLWILAPVVGAGLGLVYGLFTTRRRQVPEDD